EFFGAEVLVVDGVPRVVHLRVGEVADGAEEAAVGEFGVVELGGSGGAEEEAAEGWDGEVGGAVVAEPVPGAFEEVVLVGVASAWDGVGEVPQTAGGVVGVAAFGFLVGGGWVEEVAVFGGEEHEEAVHDAEELPVVVLGGEGAGGEVGAEGG